MMTNQNKIKLWRESEVTNNFFSPELSFFKEKRFKFHSIYGTTEEGCSTGRRKKRQSETEEIARKISQMVDESEKNDERANKNGKPSFMKISANKSVKPCGKSLSLREPNTNIS